MKNRLILISAGDFGREVAAGCRAVPCHSRDWEFTGFLDSRTNVLDAYPGEGPILGDPETYKIGPNDRFLCAMGDPATRLKYAAIIESRGGRFATIVMPTSIVRDRTVLGPGTIVCHHVELTTDIVIGAHVAIMSKVIIGHNAQVGDGSVVSSFCFLGGHSRVGRGAMLAPHSTILPRAVVGDFCTVGAGSVVIKRAPAHSTVFGVPAVVISRRDSASTNPSDPSIASPSL